MAALLIAALAALPAEAAVTISNSPTLRMTCVANVCRPTHADAILNAGDLDALLAGGSVTVMAGPSAKDIVVVAPLTWTSGVSLTLEANTSLSIRAPLTVSGTGGLTIVTGERRGGILSIGGRGQVTFESLSSSLTINRKAYMLANSVKSLVSDIAANPYGSFALSNDYDALADGSYDTPPIGGVFYGSLEGLGNTISRLKIRSVDYYSALITWFSGVTIQHLHLKNIDVGTQQGASHVLGGLVGHLAGPLFEDSVSGLVTGGGSATAGGLIGFAAEGTIANCYADVAVSAGSSSVVGGLVGELTRTLSNSYATGAVTIDVNSSGGGLVGGILAGSGLAVSYATGLVSGPTGDNLGGLVGIDYGADVTSNYWDTSTSGVAAPGKGAGRPHNDPGITGLTGAEFQAGLPTGFDPAIWGEKPNINGGLPYLLNDPPG